jgi:hypothetical protein
MAKPFHDHAAWERALLDYADGCVPAGAWGSRINVGGTPLIPIIRSARVNVTITPERL